MKSGNLNIDYLSEYIDQEDQNIVIGKNLNEQNGDYDERRESQDLNNENQFSYDDERIERAASDAHGLNEEKMNESEHQNNGEDEEEDEDDDDDGGLVNVVISGIKPYSTQSGAGSQLNRQKSKTGQITASSSGTANPALASSTGAAPGSKVTVQAKGIDLDAPGMINDQPTYDYDLQEVKDEDKPWRKPGADITDYFNYGFNEETWIAYCAKQKRLRAENANFKASSLIGLKFLHLCVHSSSFF